MVFYSKKNKLNNVALRKYYLNIALLAVLMLVSGCSTQKNTWVSRTYHSTTTKFNIYFNGSQSYKEGMQNIAKSNTDNYSQILPMFPSSNHESLSGATSNMNRAIEKCRKSIKLHSIKKKPQKNIKKWNSSEYRNWYDQSEFNPALSEAWLLLAKSEFHKGDFLGSVGTFSYIMKYYATVPNVVAEAQIWTARAYSEMNWLYEAEDILTKLSTQKLDKKNTALFSATMADALLKKKQYKEAIPYLKLAIEGEKDGKLKTRFKYILAQIYTLTDEKKMAESYYSDVIKASPPYEMEFNAQINRAQLFPTNVTGIEKQLKKMAGNRKNKDYLDQIYGALGNVFLNAKDTTKALTYYAKAIEKSTKNGTEKGVVLAKAGDLNYLRRNYINAEPNYNEASKIFTNEYPDFSRISKRAEVLADLVKENSVVILQDSLQKMAKMSEKDRLDAINKIIEGIKKAEKEELEKQNQKNNPAFAQNAENDDNFTMPQASQMIGGIKNNSGSDWYFYNANTIKSGKIDFKKIWGNRKLEDNWRKINKSANLFDDNSTTASTINENQITTDQNQGTNNLNAEKTTQAAVTDNKTVEFYLQQIPFSDKQREKSNESIADALFNMGFIFKDRMDDYQMAIKTFDEFEKRFPTDNRVLETIYQRFLAATRYQDNVLKEKYRQQLLSKYPSSGYAKMLSDPNFIQTLGKMYQEQDSLYNQTYVAYTKSDFETVFKNTDYVKKKYPLSSLMPKFEFLNSLSIGKTQHQSVFKNSLDSLVAHYPESDVSAMAKDILALMKQGNVAQQGKSHGTLLEKRAEDNEITEAKNTSEFSADLDGKHRLMLIGNVTDSLLNKLMYTTALFNFSKFMIKDFDLETSKISNNQQALSVTNLESYDEANWYQKTLLADKELGHFIDSLKLKIIPISDDNFGKLKTSFTLDQYIDFQKGILSKDVSKTLATTEKLTQKMQENKSVQTKQDIKTAEAKPASLPDTKQNTVVKDTKQQDLKQITDVKLAETKPSEVKQEQKTTAETTKTTAAVEQPAKTEAKPTEPEKPKVEEPQAWFKNTYAFRPNAPHFVALYIPTGSVNNFEAIQQAFDKYNSANYGVLNLKTSLENFGKQQAVIIGTFVDAVTAKSYLLRMLKEPTIIEATKGLNKRNLVGTQENLNIMVQKNDLNTYFEFMKEFYLK